MVTFESANHITSWIVGIYGLLILTCPDIFFCSYLYRSGFWSNYTRSVASGGPYAVSISVHLLRGIGLTWLSWALMYSAIGGGVDAGIEELLTQINVIIWFAWVVLDHWVRMEKIYSSIASFANAVAVNGLLGMWLTLALRVKQ